MISELKPKNIMISDFGAKKIPNTGMAHFIVSESEGKKLYQLINSSRQVLFLLITHFWGKFLPITV